MNKPILLVEDDENDVHFLTKAMKRLGIENAMHVARDGQEAIDYVTGVGKYSDRWKFPVPYLVLLDLKLPQIKGLDVLKHLRANHGPSPIIVILSSSGNDSDVSSAYALGANAYLTKPLDFEGLVKMVGSISDFWLGHNVANPSRR